MKRGETMKRFLVLMSMMSMLLIIGAGNVFAGGVNFDLLCPNSVTAGSTFTVTVANIQNWDCVNSVFLKRYMIGFVANPDAVPPGTLGNNVGGLGIYGPYQKYLGTGKTVPAATCLPGISVIPGTILNFNITTPASPSVPGKIAMVVIDFLTNTGQDQTGGMCVVNLLTPAPL